MESERNLLRRRGTRSRGCTPRWPTQQERKSMTTLSQKQTHTHTHTHTHKHTHIFVYTCKQIAHTLCFYLGEGFVQDAHAIAENIWEADDKRTLVSTLDHVLHHLKQVNVMRVLSCGIHHDVALVVDRKVRVAPAANVIHFVAVGSRPVGISSKILKK